MKKEIKLGCPMEYEVDNIIHNGLFLRENEVNIVFKELEKLNKQKEVIDKIKEYIKEKDLTNNMNFMDDGIGNLFKDILELLEEIE